MGRFGWELLLAQGVTEEDKFSSWLGPGGT